MQAVTADDPGERHARITTTDYQMEFLISTQCALGARVCIPDKSRFRVFRAFRVLGL